MNIEDMNSKQLRELIDEATRRLHTVMSEEITQARAHIAAIMEQTGLTFEELIPKKTRKPRKKKEDNGEYTGATMI